MQNMHSRYPTTWLLVQRVDSSGQKRANMCDALRLSKPKKWPKLPQNESLLPYETPTQSQHPSIDLTNKNTPSSFTRTPHIPWRNHKVAISGPKLSNSAILWFCCSLIYLLLFYQYYYYSTIQLQMIIYSDILLS